MLKRAALLLAALALPLAGCAAVSPVPSATVTTSAGVPSASVSPTASATTASATPSATATAPKPTPTKTASGYTMADIRKHADAKSCWSVVDGNVYDLTKWVSRHPGGRSRIVAMCGTDGSSTFHSEHRKESEPASILGGYKLGKLA